MQEGLGVASPLQGLLLDVHRAGYVDRQDKLKVDGQIGRH